MVTGVCRTENIELVKNLGAKNVIDCKKENFSNCTELFDIIFDASGHMDNSEVKKTLARKVRFISVTKSGHAKLGLNSLTFLTELAEKGYIKPVIDKIYTFDQVQEAHRHVEKGNKKGSVVISIIKN